MNETRKPQEIPGQFEIKPTGTSVTEQYSDVTLTILFSNHANQISSERAAIWQRFTAMLVGNSIVSAFSSGATTPSYQVAIATGFGILLCGIWYAMTIDGWRIFKMRINKALEFVWTAFNEHINPFSITLEYEAGRFGGRLFYLAIATIVVFGLLHIAILGNILKLW